MSKLLEKFNVVRSAIESQLKSEGVDLSGLEDQISKITEGYMLVVQCLWFRITSDKKVENLLTKYEDILKDVMNALVSNEFDNLVYTYRSLYTNLYEAKKGEPRQYKLSKESFEDFINKVNSGEIKVLVKPIKAKAKKNTSKEVKMKTSFALGGLLSQTTHTKQAPKKAKKTTTNVVEATKVKISLGNPKEKMKGSVNSTIYDSGKRDNDSVCKLVKQVEKVETTTKVVGWIKTELASIEDTTFVKMVLVDDSKLFGKITKCDDDVTQISVRNQGDFEIDNQNIKDVYVYVKSGKKRKEKASSKEDVKKTKKTSTKVEKKEKATSKEVKVEESKTLLIQELIATAPIKLNSKELEKMSIDNLNALYTTMCSMQ